MTKFAVVSSDSNPTYAFFAPLTCAIWKARGYTPLLLLVGQERDWILERRLRIVHDQALDAGAKVVFVSHDEPAVRTATVAQVARLFAFDHVDPSDYLLTSDIDMWPVNDWVGSADGSDLQLYYANAHDDEGRVHYPMCYIGGRASVWSDIMRQGLMARPDLNYALSLCQTNPPRDDRHHRVGGLSIPLDTWNFDETYFGECLSRWDGYPSRCQMISRDMEAQGQRRIDRSNWKIDAKLDAYADAHLLRPGFHSAYWAHLHKLFTSILPARGAWAQRFYLDLTATSAAERKRQSLIEGARKA